MQNLIHNPVYNVLLLLTAAGEFILPWILKRFYKAYDSNYICLVQESAA